MTSLLETDARPRPTASNAAPLSLVLSLGPPSVLDAALLADLLALADAEPAGELIVVDDGAPADARDLLGGLVGHVRVAHHLSTVGAGSSLAQGVELATNDAVLVLLAGAPERSWLAEARAWFALDPGASVAAGPNGALLLRKQALATIDGPAALRALEAPVAGVEGLAATLGRAGWRSRLEPLGELSPWQGWDPVPEVNAAHAGRLDWRPPLQPSELSPGLNVVGLLEAACGVGDAARRTIEAIAHSSVPYSTHHYNWHGSPLFPYEHRDAGRLAYDTNLIALNADLLNAFSATAGVEFWSRRYTIGMWFWELETLSSAIRAGFRFVNELWASTRFLADAFAAATDKHVEVIPLPVRRRDGAPPRTRADFGLGPNFLFLASFDFGSVALRKNGLGAVEAFSRAFAPGEGPVLLLKTLNASWDPEGWAALQRGIGGRRDIRVLDGYLDDEAMSGLIGLADCYVSLHRAEGFGLTPAEAMAWGRPVVATGYSGNLEFMTEENSFLVPYDLVPVDRRLARIYPPGARWAEPRVDAAAEAMRRVVDDPALAASRAASGQRDIRARNSIEASAAAIERRFAAISEARAAGRRDRAGALRAGKGGGAR